MADRSYSVVVLPGQWEGSLEELAGAMKPVSRRETSQVLPLLARGPMTLEADLSVDEADVLRARLNKLGVPACVVDEGGEVHSATAHDGAAGAESVPSGRSPGAGTSQPEEVGDTGSKEPRSGEARSVESQEGEDRWAAVLGERRETASPPPSPQSEESADLQAPSFGAEPAQLAPPEDDESDGDVSPRGDDSPRKEEGVAREAPPQPPSPGPPEGRGFSSGPEADSFDANRMTEALKSRDDSRPPYKPEGFDDGPSHIPALAALLSLLAPGAGQIYNGQKESATDYGLRFALLAPWYEAVRQAHRRAHEIRTYWAPRPEPGALFDAVKYAFVWWIVAGSAVAALAWLGGKAYELVDVPDEPTITEADVRSAFDSAQTDVDVARLDGLEAVSRYIDRGGGDHERFTMSDEERAERLFRRGIAFCEDGQYATCESAMKRVSNLHPDLRRNALRLQAWASVKKDGGTDDPMPEFEGVESLEEYERARADEEGVEELEEVDEIEQLEEIADEQEGAADRQGEPDDARTGDGDPGGDDRDEASDEGGTEEAP